MGTEMSDPIGIAEGERYESSFNGIPRDIGATVMRYIMVTIALFP
jgi:hypothetical protein